MGREVEGGKEEDGEGDEDGGKEEREIERYSRLITC